MKKTRIAYWIFTALVSLMMLLSATMYLTNAQMPMAFTHLGFPQYFRIELAVAKVLGVLALLIPQVSGRVKEWAYAGFGFTFISAFIAHTNAGDPVSARINVLIAFALLACSYVCYSLLQGSKSPAAVQGQRFRSEVEKSY